MKKNCNLWWLNVAMIGDQTIQLVFSMYKSCGLWQNITTTNIETIKKKNINLTFQNNRTLKNITSYLKIIKNLNTF